MQTKNDVRIFVGILLGLFIQTATADMTSLGNVIRVSKNKNPNEDPQVVKEGCRGVLISYEHVLTFKNCVKEKVWFNPVNKVWFKPVNSEKWVSVEGFVTKEDFNMAVLKLSKDLTSSEKISFVILPDNPNLSDSILDVKSFARGSGLFPRTDLIFMEKFEENEFYRNIGQYGCDRKNTWDYVYLQDKKLLGMFACYIEGQTKEERVNLSIMFSFLNDKDVKNIKDLRTDVDKKY